LLASACSTTGSGGARLQLGESVAPPAGAFGLCVRDPQTCGLSAGAVETVAAEPDALTTVAGAGSGEKMSADKALGDRAGPMAFAWAVEPGDAVLRLAMAVNTQVNAALTYRSDDEVWGQEEKWVLPLSVEGATEGDCEDYALEKRGMLLSFGVPIERLALATAWSAQTGRHAVLLLRTNDGDYVLDNTTDAIRRVGDTAYQWTAIQSGANLLTWSAVTGFEA